MSDRPGWTPPPAPSHVRGNTAAMVMFVVVLLVIVVAVTVVQGGAR